MFESFRAGSDDGGLQSSDGVVLKSRDIGEIADHASGGGRQARVCIDLQVQTSGFNGHGCWPERRRRLPGNRGNSRDRLCKDARLAGPCRWCSTFRKCNDLPASRIAHKRSDLAWWPLRKTLPEHGRLRQDEGQEGTPSRLPPLLKLRMGSFACNESLMSGAELTGSWHFQLAIAMVLSYAAT